VVIGSRKVGLEPIKRKIKDKIDGKQLCSTLVGPTTTWT